MVTSYEERPVDAPARRTKWTPPAVGPGLVLGVLGAIGIIVSLFLAWRDPGVHPGDIPLAFLWRKNTAAQDPSLLLALIPAAVVVAVGAVRFGALLRLIGGAVVLAVAALFAFQLNRVLPAGASLTDSLGTGFYVGAVGGALAFVSGLVPGRLRRARV